MLYIIHIDAAGIVDEIAVRFSFFGCRLSRNGFFLKDPLQLGFQKIQPGVNVIGIAVVIVHAAFYHTVCFQQILLRRLWSIFPTILGLVIGIRIKDHKHRLSHEIHVRKFPGFPVGVIAFRIGKPLDDGIAVNKL